VSAEDLAPYCAIFARGLRDKATALEDMALTAKQSAALRKSIFTDIRKLCDMLFPAVRPYGISVAAAEKAAALGVDLQAQTWDTQTSFDPGRQVFHYEHVATVADIVEAVLAAGSVEQAADELAQRVRVAWILKEEDARLSKFGYRHRRPDPDAAYAEAGIEMAPPTS
jgi:hypothetical protein